MLFPIGHVGFGVRSFLLADLSQRRPFCSVSSFHTQVMQMRMHPKASRFVICDALITHVCQIDVAEICILI